MTKRDYADIAAVIAMGAADPIRFFSGDLPAWDLAEESMRQYIAHNLANVLATTNPRFDRRRFLIACQVSAFPVPESITEKELP